MELDEKREVVIKTFLEGSPEDLDEFVGKDPRFLINLLNGADSDQAETLITTLTYNNLGLIIGCMSSQELHQLMWKLTSHAKCMIYNAMPTYTAINHLPRFINEWVKEYFNLIPTDRALEILKSSKSEDAKKYLRLIMRGY